MTGRWLPLALMICGCAATAAGSPEVETAEHYYSVETIPAPDGVVPECGGLGFLPDGRLVAVFDHGEVCFYDPAQRHWSTFAEGLHSPLGVLPISGREVLVCQRAELTRLIDSRGTGKADIYECVSDRWGISGNYHEFAYGPVRDARGNLYVALGMASPDGVTRYEVRGRTNSSEYNYGRKSMYSSVPYRGWVAKIAPDGTFTPVADGFRQPNGIVLDPEGRLFVTDNQGDWVGTSKLFCVVPGAFYGHPGSLSWEPDWGGPLSALELDKKRHEGNVLFPHAILANSPGQPVIDTTGGKFGPFAGQMFVTEFNTPRVLRVMLETVHGELQGATTPFYDGPPLRTGNIRLAFAPDGSLWVGQTERPKGWPAAAGIQRIAWKGQTPMDVLGLHLTATGFEFTFTKPVDPASAMRAEAYSGRRYYYLYRAGYGSPRIDVHDVRVGRVSVSPDGRRVGFDVDALKAGYIYEFTLRGIRAADGTPLINGLIAYTANRLQDGASRPIPRPAPTGEIRGRGSDQPPDSSL